MQEDGSPDDIPGRSTKQKVAAKKRRKSDAKQKRIPASPASETGRSRKLRKSKSSKRKSTARRSDAQESERRFFWVAHGQINAGFVEQIDEIYKALDVNERELGSFGSLKAAADAVSASFEGVVEGAL
jgi:hypothetical protein